MKTIYFDGVCVLCNKFVKFVIEHDPTREFRFSTIGGESYQKLVERHPEVKEVDSVVYEREGRVYLKGEAVREIIQDLSTYSTVKRLSKVIPLFLLNFYYSLVASTRYRIFGKYDACPTMPPEWRDRFLP